ncbi:uncharacterized protein LOC129947533 [Eupeodes corollae]|uniref:uncharacterized protein LOC129947533 n=1 Tax=Eupeodes corollae TaxID=290404 RepID=UPI00249329CB|nr:uncharacterized protein LOC129947533 [Eupeodes corollae]
MHCETHFKTHLRINSDGRFTVRLPFTKSPQCLGNSRQTAVSCLLSMERRLVRDPNLYQQYRNFMNEYIAMGHMQKIPHSEVNIADNKCFYLPHHSVLKPSSTTTKLRVVFNASRKTSSNVSLNDILGVGPTIQRDLFSILINFRQFKIPISADVTKMYRQIQIDSQDWNYQRIVWRDDLSNKIQDYWLTTVTYGTSSAPFLATRALFQIANDCISTHPIISHIIKNHFYVDDLLTGADSEEEVTNIREGLENVLEGRGFELRKWKSSSKEFIKKIAPDKRDTECIDFDSEPTKLLGLYWNPDGDYFSFHASLTNKLSITKRSILSESAKIFDPLGLLSPATIALKILFQQLWVEQPNGKKLEWDDIVPERLAERWCIFTEEFKYFKNIKVDRWIHTRDLRSCELHGFCDASETAYSAVIYCRTEDQGNIHVKIVAAKTRVAPLKQQSLPRLELCGALLLARLFESIRKALNNEIQSMTAWTDSQIVLSWLNSQPRRWTTFVGNRTAAILNICQADWWHYVPSQDNPADIASRGASPKTLKSSSIWWQGPMWLIQPKSYWPSQQSSSSYQTKNEEKRINFQVFHTTESDSVLEKILTTSSSFDKIVRMMAYWLRLRSILQFKLTFDT